MTYLKLISFFLLFLSLTIYFFGYVPKTIYQKHDLKNRTYLKKQTINKVVIIVIDSLRPDMVYKKSNLWPKIMNIINKTWAYSTIAEIQPPSMSLAKIKCIITGAVVGFIDVMFNTDSGKIKQENLIDILIRYRRFVINFYGDITWMKLFPDQFKIRDPTTPFFVRDYIQVDYNVSRNIPNILSSYHTWDMVIMHYLGLDHIGHAEGPFNKAVDEKLSEMDNKIGTLINALLKKYDSDKTLIILTADHGMSDLGGHGGSSKNEITVPLLFFNKKFRNSQNYTTELISQNDISPALALLLGVPIPADNIGVIPLNILSLINDPLDQTRALIANYVQLTKIKNPMSSDVLKSFSKINVTIYSIHRNCSPNYSTICINNLSYQHNKLIRLMNDMKNELKLQFIQHNFIALEIAHFLIVMSCLISFSILLFECGIIISIPGILFILSISSMILTLIYLENINNRNFTAFKITSSALIFILTCHTLSGTKKLIKSCLPTDLKTISSEFVVVLCLFINMFGSAIPCFIKEENQVWYYLNNTLLVLYLFQELIAKIINKKEPRSILNSTYFATTIILIVDRFLRTLNRTGELWSHIPDAGDWLVRKDNKEILMILISICLFIVAIFLWEKDFILNSIFNIILFTLNGIHRYADITEHQMISDISVWIYYLLIVFQILFYLITRKLTSVRYRFSISSIIFYTSFIICRQPNIILWTGIIIKRFCYRKIWSEEIRNYSIIFQFLIFNIIGMVSFFHQGNSNSLTTLDVQPGFVGMTSFVAPIIFPVVAIHTFAGNFYWIMLWIEWLAKDQPKYKSVSKSETNQEMEIKEPQETVTIIKLDHNEPIEKNLRKNSHFFNIINSFTLITSLFLLLIYLFSVFHKKQINAWSVYAPKLVYFSFQGGFLLVVYSIVARLYFW